MLIRDREADFDEGINLMPLIDILVFMVMFFLVATKFREEERSAEVQLPGLSSSVPLSAAPSQLIVNIREDGAAIVAGKRYEGLEFEALLAQAAVGQRDVLIRADERSLHRHFARVAGLCRRAGIGEVKIGYVVEEPRPGRVE